MTNFNDEKNLLREIDLLRRIITNLKKNKIIINGKKHYEVTEEVKELLQQWHEN